MFYKNEHLEKMNMAMNEQALIEKATQAVESVTGLTFMLEPSSQNDGPGKYYAPDGLLFLSTPAGPIRFAAECKTRIAGESQLSLIRDQLSAWEGEARPLLVTQHLTPRLVDHCREIDLDFIDGSGNCLIRSNAVWIMVRGNKPANHGASSLRPYRGSTSYAALRVIYALLCRPGLLSAPYRDVASAAGVSVGAVVLILQDLEERALLSPRDKHKRRKLLDLPALEAEWASNYPSKLRPRLHPRRFSAPSRDWWHEAELGSNASWGGEVAAFKLTGYLRPETQTIYLDAPTTGDDMNQLIRTHRLRADATGAVEILQAFWSFDNDAGEKTVNPLLIYADLLAIKDSRAQEAASAIRKTFLHA